MGGVEMAGLRQRRRDSTCEGRVGMTGLRQWGQDGWVKMVWGRRQCGRWHGAGGGTGDGMGKGHLKMVGARQRRAGDSVGNSMGDGMSEMVWGRRWHRDGAGQEAAQAMVQAMVQVRAVSR